MTTRREVIAAGLAAGALPLFAGRGFAAGIELGPAAPFSFDALKETARGLAAEPYAPPVVAEAELLESIDYDLHNQITYREDGDALGRRARRGEGAVLPSRGATSRSRSRSTSSRTARRGSSCSRPTSSTCRTGIRRGKLTRRGLRRLPGDGPGRGERLDGGARRLLLPHLGLLGAVRALGARASRSIRAGRGRRSSRASRRFWLEQGPGGGHRHLRAAREPAGHRRLPDRQQPRSRGGASSRTSTPASSCAATSSGSASRR